MYAAGGLLGHKLMQLVSDPPGHAGAGPGGGGDGETPPLANLDQRAAKSAPLPSIEPASAFPPGDPPPLISWQVLLFGAVALGRQAHGSHDTLYLVEIVRMASS